MRGPRFLSAAIALGLALLATPLRAEEGGLAVPGIVGTDDREMLDSVSWPWNAVGRVNVGGQRHCTGTLVGARLVLTAAHCLLHPRTGRVLPRTIHFLAGYRRGDYLAHGTAGRVDCGAAGKCTSDRRVPDRLWPPQQDWAILVLREPIDIRPVPVRPFGEGTRAVARAGYGRDRAHLLSLDEACELTGSGASGRLLRHDCDATEGDSGSALLAGEGEDRALVAIDIGYVGQGADTQGLAIAAEAILPRLKALQAAPER